MNLHDFTWTDLGLFISCLLAVYGFLVKYFPPSHVKAEAMAKAQSQGSITAEELMKALRENNREILTQIMGVIKEGFVRMETTDEKIAEAIRQQSTAFIEMGFKIHNREQVTETLHKTGHEHMKRIEENQSKYTQNQVAIMNKMDEIARDLRERR